MLEIMADDVLWSFTNEVHEAGHSAVIIDETADISVKEQVPTCFRIVHKNLETQELCCGFFNTADTRMATLFSILKDVLCRFNLTIDNWRG